MSIMKQYGVSDRHRSAFHLLGNESLREGLQILTKNPEKVAIENVGIDERRVLIRFYQLSEPDLLMIDKLMKKLKVPSASLIVRNAAEVLIDKYDLSQFKKPPSWQSRPLGIETIGVGGKNPEKVSPYVLKNKSLSFPMWLWRELPSKDISQFARESIDKCDASSLIPLSDQELASDKRRHTVALYEHQHGRLTALKNKLPQFQSEGQVLLAIMRNAV